MVRPTKPTHRRDFLRGLGVAGIAGMAGCTGGGGGDGGDGDGGDGGGGTPQVTEWAIGGSSEGSPANAWVQGFAAQMDTHSDVLRLNPRLASGFVANAVRVNDGDLDMAMSYQYVPFIEQRDIGVFSEGGDIGPLESDIVSTIPTIHVPTSPIFTYGDRDDIETVYDLDGMSVGLNVAGSGNANQAILMFEEIGVEPTFEFHTFAEMGEAIDSRRVDAQMFVIINNAIVPGAYQPTFESVDLKVVDTPPDAIDATQAAHPYIAFAEFRGDNLNIDKAGEPFEPAQAISTPTTIVTSSDHDADLVYEFVKIIVDYQDELGQYHGALNATGIGEGRHNFAGAADGTPFHEGAVRYYEEEGIDFPEQP